MKECVLLFACLFCGSEQSNKLQYRYSVVHDKPIVSYSEIVAVMPNADRIVIPLINNTIPAIIVKPGKGRDCELVLDYEDKDAAAALPDQRQIIYGNDDPRKKDQKTQPVAEKQKVDTEKKRNDGVLETFLSIQKELLLFDLINMKDDSASVEAMNSLAKKVEEIKKMTIETNSMLGSIGSKSIEFKVELNEIKNMLGDMRKELVNIKNSIETKASAKKDIIEPSLPIVDKGTIPKK
jgi:hypothetical protein